MVRTVREFDMEADQAEIYEEIYLQVVDKCRSLGFL